MENVRRQATLFLRNIQLLENIRQEFNPEQARLINAHVTLLRGDEVFDWELIASKLRAIAPQTVTLNFGSPLRNGNLLYLPCIGSTSEFHQLRDLLLNQAGTSVRKHDPHITLIHPRNGACTDAIFETVSAKFTSFSYTFDEISFIRQENGGVWETVERFELMPSGATKSD